MINSRHHHGCRTGFNITHTCTHIRYPYSPNTKTAILVGLLSRVVVLFELYCRELLYTNYSVCHCLCACMECVTCLSCCVRHMPPLFCCQPPTRKDVSVDKELEKMKLKYTTLRQTTERNIDTIAELQLELKERQTLIRQLEDELRQQQDQAHAHAQQAAARDEKIVHWRREANQRSVEIARLKFDARQKEDRIAQLRKLLIQQTELMHLQGFNSGSVSDAEYEEHISEV